MLEVSQHDGRGRLSVGGTWIGFDDRTFFKDVERGSTRIEPSTVKEILALGGAASARAGFRVDEAWFDLEHDAGEVASHEKGAGGGLAARLDELGRALRESALRSGERVVLTPDAIDRLREIGYAE